VSSISPFAAVSQDILNAACLLMTLHGVHGPDFKKWHTENGIQSESLTSFKPRLNSRAELQIRVVCNVA
jgi:hypothetical protein